MTWWACVAGAARYLAGAERSEAGQTAVASKCAACPRMRLFRSKDLNAGLCGWLVKWFLPSHAPLTGWCGAPGEVTKETCGCLVLGEAAAGEAPEVVAITKGGEKVGMRAAGKTTRAGEACPVERWGREGNI